MRRLLVCVVVLWLAPWSALAQEGLPFEEGDRVRVSAEALAGTFRVVGWSEQVLRLEADVEAPDPAVDVPWNTITRLELSRGHRSGGRRALRGAGIGFLIGGGTGAVIGLRSGDDTEGFIRFTRGEKAVVLGVLMGVSGAVVGTVVGLASRGERWERISLEEQLGLIRTNTGALGISFSYTF